MKKQLSFTTNEKGFYLPYVLFISLIILILIISSIQMYRNEVYFSTQLMEQLKIETLVQMGRAKYKETYVENENKNQVKFKFPEGTVIIEKKEVIGLTVELLIKIHTNDQTVYEIINYLQLTETGVDERE